MTSARSAISGLSDDVFAGPDVSGLGGLRSALEDQQAEAEADAGGRR